MELRHCFSSYQRLRATPPPRPMQELQWKIRARGMTCRILSYWIVIRLLNTKEPPREWGQRGPCPVSQEACTVLHSALFPDLAFLIVISLVLQKSFF